MRLLRKTRFSYIVSVFAHSCIFSPLEYESLYTVNMDLGRPLLTEYARSGGDHVCAFPLPRIYPLAPCTIMPTHDTLAVCIQVSGARLPEYDVAVSEDTPDGIP
jgi:hypothetical protein